MAGTPTQDRGIDGNSKRRSDSSTLDRTDSRYVAFFLSLLIRPMKLPIALLVAAFPLVAVAQEETPTPAEKLSLRATDSSAEMEPSVSVPSERTVKEYPRPGAVATPTPTPKKAASPRKESADKPARSKSPAPAKAASPSPAPAAANAPVPKAAVPAVKEMENRWLNALQSHDTSIVQTLVAEDYIGVTATGKFVNKAGLLAEIKKDKNSYTSATNTRMDVRVHGDSAVVVGTTRQIGKDEAGKAFTYSYRWTDTWTQRSGQWLCIASQSTQVPNQQTLF